MSFADWVPSITSSTILTVIGFVAGIYYKAKVENSIKHKLNADLEKLKADLRRGEEELKAILRARDEEISALRNNVLSGMASRNAALDKRRLDAAEKLWSEAMLLSPFKTASEMTKSVNFEKLIASSDSTKRDGQKYQSFAKAILDVCKIDAALKSNTHIANSERLFVSAKVWALFSTYRLVVSIPSAYLLAASSGIGKDLVRPPEEVMPLLKTALPDRAEYLEKFGYAAIPYLIDDLEEALLLELAKSLEGDASSGASIRQATALMREVNRALAPEPPSIDSEIKDDVVEP